VGIARCRQGVNAADKPIYRVEADATLKVDPSIASRAVTAREVEMSGVGDSRQEGLHGNIDAIDPLRSCEAKDFRSAIDL
jgi:hypothetical protein